MGVAGADFAVWYRVALEAEERARLSAGLRAERVRGLCDACDRLILWGDDDAEVRTERAIDGGTYTLRVCGDCVEREREMLKAVG